MQVAPSVVLGRSQVVPSPPNGGAREVSHIGTADCNNTARSFVGEGRGGAVEEPRTRVAALDLGSERAVGRWRSASGGLPAAPPAAVVGRRGRWDGARDR